MGGMQLCSSIAADCQNSLLSEEERSTSALCSSSTGAMAEPTADRWNAMLCCSPWGLPSGLWLWLQCGWSQHPFQYIGKMHPALLPM